MNCPECSYVNPEGAKFCNECGTALMERPADKPLHQSERKQVTVLFSDLSGYTAMNERLDPEEVKEIMSRVFGEITRVIARYEGFIERFIGDAVMAVFGVPSVHEDDPARAIRSALEIHDLVKALSPKLELKVGHQLSMHSGINTGLVVTGEVDLKKGTHGLTGDTINLASRLEGIAGPDEILVGENTYKLARNHFKFEPMRPTKVKGKLKNISAFKVISARTLDSRVSFDRQVTSIMVGRDRELDRLDFQVQKAVNGQGSVVNVVGEAGIGKSRLMAELKKRDSIQRVTLLEGRAISIGKNLSFHPIINLLKHWAHITEDDSEIMTVDKLELAIRSIHPEGTDEILPFVATLMGMKLIGRYAERVKGIEGEALEKLILKNIRDLITKGSEVQPMVIVMEDLHWADKSSLEFLQNLYGLSEKHRLLFINVFRPGYLGEIEVDVTSRSHERIELKPIGKQDGESLINNMLDIKGLPFSVKEQILVRAGGNPFFIEEVVHSLIDDGMVVRGAHGFDVSKKIDRVVIPPTINDVLIARIDRLEDKTRELVKVAAVIGQSFFYRIIKDVAKSIDRVDDRLSYLKKVQLIRERRRFQELEYLFKHALAQEAAYESTLLQQRKILHLRVAQSIEKIFRERLHEFYGMLAFHYGKGDAPEKVEEYMAKAGEEAMRSSASSEALHYFREALKLYGDRYGDNADPQKLISFKTNLAQAHLNRGEFLEAVFYLDDILDRRGYRFPRDKWISIVNGLWNFFGIIKLLYSPIKFRTHIPDKRELEELDLLYRKGLCLVHISTGRMIFECGFPYLKKLLILDLRGIPQGQEWLSYSSAGLNVAGFSFLGAKLLERAKHISHGKGLNELGIALGLVTFAINKGSWGAVPDLDASLADTALGKGDLYKLTAYLLHLGCIKLECGNFHQAELCAEKLHLITESYGYNFASVHYHFVKTNILIRQRNFHRAIVEADKGVSIADQADMNPPKLRSLGLKIIVEMLLFRPERAESAVKKGEALLAELGFVGPLYRAPFILGRLLTHIEQLKKALKSGNRSRIQKCQQHTGSSAKQAANVSKKHALYRTWIFKSIGEYYWLINKQGKAVKCWNNAIKEGEKLGSLIDLSSTYFEVGKRLLEPQSKHKKLNGIDAKGYLEKAAVLFEELGFDRDLEELKAVRSST